jgi:hypothetical protein
MAKLTLGTVLAAIAVIFVLSGIAGIPFGPSGQGGWWLDIVGIFLGVAAFIVLRSRRTA